MANTAKILAPRRGLSTTMAESTLVLAAGELFIEKNATTGVYKIKIGDGTTQYKNLAYAFDGEAKGASAAYGTCATAAATAAKAITVSSDQNFKLEKGAFIAVKFTNTNSASNVTLSVNGSTAKSIWYSNAAYTGTSADVCGAAGKVNTYIFDGTYWVWVAHGNDNNTTYAAITSTEITTGTDTAQKTVRADYLKTGVNGLIDAKAWTGTSTQYSQIQNPDPTVNYYIDDNVTPSNNSEQR